MNKFLKRGITFAQFKLHEGWIVICRSAIRLGLSLRPIRIGINRAYNNLSAEERSAYHSKYWDLFRGYDGASWNGRWGLKIAERTIYLPLRAERMWLDWDHCISLLGHDMEIKKFYFVCFIPRSDRKSSWMWGLTTGPTPCFLAVWESQV